MSACNMTTSLPEIRSFAIDRPISIIIRKYYHRLLFDKRGTKQAQYPKLDVL